MIPTSLKPGTEIVCVFDSPINDAVPCGLKKGNIYTVRGYSVHYTGEISVLLNEVQAPRHPLDYEGSSHPERGFYRMRFRLLQLPECLTELLNTAPTPKKKKKVKEECLT